MRIVWEGWAALESSLTQAPVNTARLLRSVTHVKTSQGWHPEPTLMAVWVGELAQLGHGALYMYIELYRYNSI
jgi:hypothetical protein